MSSSPSIEDATRKAAALPDGELLSRLRRRDPVALEVLYDRYCGIVHGLALRMLRRTEAAEEITQDVFWQLWRSDVQYDPDRGRFSTWLFAITRSRCLDRLRRDSRRPATEPLPEEPIARAQENPESEAYAAERRRRVVEALAQLPDAQRRALELGFFSGMSHREIAERLAEPLGTIKSRIKMGMDKLRSSLRRVGSAP